MRRRVVLGSRLVQLTVRTLHLKEDYNRRFSFFIAVVEDLAR